MAVKKKDIVKGKNINEELLENEEVVTDLKEFRSETETVESKNITETNISLSEEEDLFDDEDDYTKELTTENDEKCNDILDVVKNTPKKVSLKDMTITPSVSKAISKPFGEAGVATCIDGGRCGKRWMFGDDVKERLGITDSVQFGFIPDAILMGKEVPETSEHYKKIKRQGAKNIIYSSGLVKEITKHLSLDFSQKTSHTFYSVEYDESYGYPIAIIR